MGKRRKDECPAFNQLAATVTFHYIDERGMMQANFQVSLDEIAHEIAANYLPAAVHKFAASLLALAADYDLRRRWGEPGSRPGGFAYSTRRAATSRRTTPSPHGKKGPR